MLASAPTVMEKSQLVLCHNVSQQEQVLVSEDKTAILSTKMLLILGQIFRELFKNEARV